MIQSDVRRRDFLAIAMGTGLVSMAGCGGGEPAEIEATQPERVGEPLDVGTHFWPPGGLESDSQGDLWIAHGSVEGTTLTRIDAQGNRLDNSSSDASLPYLRFAVAGRIPMLARGQVSPTRPAHQGLNFIRVDALLGSGWATELGFEVVEAIKDHGLSASPSGVAYLHWVDASGPTLGNSIRATRRDADGTWGTAQVLLTRAPGEGSAQFGRQCLAIDESDAALLVWIDVSEGQVGGSVAKLMASHCTSETGIWTPAEVVRTWVGDGVVTGYTILPRVVCLGSGHWIVVGSDWMTTSQASSLWVKIWQNGAWETGETRIDVPVDAATGTTYLHISDFQVDRLGAEVLVAWIGNASNTSSLFTARGHIDGAWEPAVIAQRDVGPYAGLFGLAIGTDGRAALGWTRNWGRDAMVAVRNAFGRWESAKLYDDVTSDGGHAIRAWQGGLWAVLADRPMDNTGVPRLVLQTIR